MEQNTYTSVELLDKDGLRKRLLGDTSTSQEEDLQSLNEVISQHYDKNATSPPDESIIKNTYLTLTLLLRCRNLRALKFRTKV